MPRRRFDRFMVDVENGGNAKLGRLSDAEYRCHLSGVLPLAAKSPLRGALMIGEGLQAEASDVARQARCSPTVADRTLAKLRRLGILERDEDGIEWVHDWEDWQREPKQTQDAERARRYRERKKAERDAERSNGHAEVRDASRDGHAEVRDASRRKREVLKEKTPPDPPEGENVTIRFEGKPVGKARGELALRCLAEFNAQANTSYPPFTGAGRPSEALKRVLGALSRCPDVTFDQIQAAIVWRLGEPFWTGAAPPGAVFSPNTFEQALASAATARSQDAVGDGFIERLNARRSAA